MCKRMLLILLFSTLTLSQSQFYFSEVYERKVALDPGNRSLINQRSALELSAEMVHALPSTVIESVVENFGQDEIEISAIQQFESGTIRKNRESLISAKIHALQAETASYNGQIHYELTHFLLEIVNSGSQVQLTSERLEVSNKMLAWQNRQFMGGGLAESELIRTGLSIADIESDLAFYQAKRSDLISELSAYLDSDVQAERLPTEFPDFPLAAIIEAKWTRFDKAPSLKQQESVIQSLNAEKQSANLPLVTSMSFSAGLKIIPEFNQSFPVLGFSLESPLFSKRNTLKKIREFELNAGLDALELVINDLEIKRERWLNKWSTDSRQLDLLKSFLIPKATALYDRINNEYRAGSRSYLEVLDAQGLLTDLQERAISLRFDQALQLLEMNIILGETVYAFE